MPPTTAPIRVLVTGFGPFRDLPDNPSWTAARRLHNIQLDPDSSTVSVRRPIHITSLEIPVVYETVRGLVPQLHARPPILPAYAEPQTAPPPLAGYDFVLHVGLGRSQILRLEAQAHKHGYTTPDIEGKPGPLVDDSIPPVRGFGTGYEQFDDVLCSELNVEQIVQELKDQGIKIFTSYDPGRYLCDFIYYGSLAESKRAAAIVADSDSKMTPVLFLHCSPVGDPCTTEDVVEGIVAIIKKVVW